MKYYFIYLESPKGILKLLSLRANNKKQIKELVRREYPRHTLLNIET